MSSSGRVGVYQQVGSIRDFDKKSWTGGNLTLNSTAWADLPTVGASLDLFLTAVAGDEIEIGLSAYWLGAGASEWGMLDVATIVSNAPVNYLSSTTGTPAAEGIPAFEKTGSPQELAIGGVYRYTVQAADLSAGAVTLRLRYKTANAVAHTLSGTTNRGIQFSGKNIGRRGAAPVQITGTMPGYYPDLPPLAPHPNDDEFNDFVLGAAWTEWDPGNKITVTEDAYGLKLAHVGQNGVNNYGGVYRPLPAGDFAMVTKLMLSGPGAVGPGAGMFVAADLAAAPATADFHVLLLAFNSTNNAFQAQVHLFADYTTYSSTNYVTNLGSTWAFFRTRRIGTTFYFDVSVDGVGWANLASAVPGYTPAHIGLFVNDSSASPVSAYFRFWRQSAVTAYDQPLLGQINPTAAQFGSAVIASPNGSLWQVAVRDSGQIMADILSGQTDYARGLTPTSDVAYSNIGQITDGNNATFGASLSAAQSQYVQVDLGANRLVKRMHIIYADDGHRSVNGSLRWSVDGTNWNDVATWASDSTIERYFTVNQTARYWRHQSTAAGNGSWGIDIKTWELLG